MSRPAAIPGLDLGWEPFRAFIDHAIERRRINDRDAFPPKSEKNDYMDELMDGSTPAKLDWPCEVPEPAGKVQEVG